MPSSVPNRATREYDDIPIHHPVNAGPSQRWYQCVSHPFTVLGGGRADSNWIDKVGERFTAIRSDYVWAVPLPIISSTGAQKWAAEGEDIDWNGRDLDTAGAVDWSAKTIDTWGVTVNLVKIYFGRGQPGDKLADGSERRTDFLGTVLPRELFMAEGGSIVHKPGGAMVNVTGLIVDAGNGLSDYAGGGRSVRFRNMLMIRVPGTGTFLPALQSPQNFDQYTNLGLMAAWARYERTMSGLGRYIATPETVADDPQTCCHQCHSFEIAGAYPTDINHRHVIHWDYATNMGIGIDWSLSLRGAGDYNDPFTPSTTTASTTPGGGCDRYNIVLISERLRVVYRTLDDDYSSPCNGDPITLHLTYNGGPYASMPATIVLEQCSTAEGFSVTCGDPDDCNPGTTSTSTPSTSATTTTESTPTLPPTTTTTTTQPPTTTATTPAPTTTTTTGIGPCSYELWCNDGTNLIDCRETVFGCEFDAVALAGCTDDPTYGDPCGGATSASTTPGGP